MTDFLRITDHDDPERCQAITSAGQCKLKAMPNCVCCKAHGGARQTKSQEQYRLKNYRLAKFASKVGEKSNSDGLKSLTDEVGILRLLIEEMVGQCDDTTELIIRAGPLSDLIMKAEKLVTSCDRLDARMGNLVNKDKILLFARLVIEIISDEIDNSDILDIISTKILSALGEL